MPKVPNTFTLTSLCLPVWKCSCQKDDCKHICDGLLERDLSGASGDFFYLPVLPVFCISLPVHSMLRHSSTVGRILSPATSFLSLQSGKTMKQFDLLSESKFKIRQSSRAIGDALNMMCHFYALNVLPLGDVMMIAAVRVTFPRHQKSEIRRGDDLGNTRKYAYFSQNIFPCKVDP